MPFIKGKAPWNKGLTVNDPRVKANIESMKATNASHPKRKRVNSPESRIKMAEAKNKAYAAGWEPTCGRSKKYEHISPVAGKIFVDGTWELLVAQHLDRLGLDWERNKRRFDYVRPDGKAATYQPDFFVKTWNIYLEVKGYETELDRAKWNQFTDPLVVWRRDIINSIRNGSVSERPIVRAC